MRPFRAIVGALLVVGLGASCSSDDESSGDEPGMVCAPGKQEACACLGGGQGVQRCNATGTGFDACECPDAAGSGGSAGSAGLDSGADVDAAADASADADGPSLVCSPSCVLTVPVPKLEGTVMSSITDLSYTLCPLGPDATTDPPTCIVEVDLGQTVLSTTPSEAGASATGTLAVRARRLELQNDVDDGYITLLDSTACPPATIGFVNPSLSLDLSAPAPSVQLGCTEVLASNVSINAPQLANMQLCDANLASQFKSPMFAQIAAEIATLVETAVTEAIANRACLVPR